ncbi:hypothetical protein QU617_24455 [Pseudomonas guariconensis]|uniref:hypothetical protein n=1 Tax=Pseudomonas guariconensis TaxID=1288410 RepID=UPI0025A99935|nr:hypothetical protein [Pseudomonas guariconensis]MDM9609247.1 hypothetical protein [Pseudomonas guariconensis]MDM9614205.1 hypothetical protein [Pseudomonas guariconensis]
MRAVAVEPGFIQSTVVVTEPGKEPFLLPPVVGRSFAAGMLRILEIEFVEAAIGITEDRHHDLCGLAEALAISDGVGEALRKALQFPRPGARLIELLSQLDSAEKPDASHIVSPGNLEGGALKQLQGPVRQHRPCDIALGSTNERKLS